MKDDKAYINHILVSIDKIQNYMNNLDKQDFKKNEMVQDAVIRNIEIIGEASKNVSNNLKTSYYEIPWKEMAGMRDKLIHDYLGVDIDVVWQTILIDLPLLKKALSEIDF